MSRTNDPPLPGVPSQPHRLAVRWPAEHRAAEASPWGTAARSCEGRAGAGIRKLRGRSGLPEAPRATAPATSLEVAASSLLKIPRAVLSSRWLKFERRVKGTERPRTAHRRENVGSSGSAARTPRPRGRCAPRRGAGHSGRRLATAAQPPPYCHMSSYMLLRRNLGYEGHKTRLRTNPVIASTPRVGVSLSRAPRP